VRRHTVAQGDCIASIAFDNGLFWQTVWDDGANAALKEKRKDLYTLLPGDVVTVPDIREKDQNCPTDRRHRFRLKGVPAHVRVRLLELDGTPRANLAYQLVVDGVANEGSTDSDGALMQTIPPDARSGSLLLIASGELFDLDLGHLDPIDTVTGVQGRLRGLGHYGGPLDGEQSPQLAAAIQDFQMATGLEPLGLLDDQTRDKLREIWRG
jgi:N-acetylmuramoyl-L-alanine amidase